MNNIWILAQAKTDDAASGISSESVTEQDQTVTVVADPNDPAAETTQRGPLGGNMLLWIVLMFVIMYFFILRGPRKQKQQRKQMVQSLQKNDKIQTIGGIIGTIVDVKGDEITLKIDESNNTKIKIVSSAIGRNLSKDK